jgi:hypothetical protein
VQKRDPEKVLDGTQRPLLPDARILPPLTQLSVGKNHPQGQETLGGSFGFHLFTKGLSPGM